MSFSVFFFFGFNASYKHTQFHLPILFCSIGFLCYSFILHFTTSLLSLSLSLSIILLLFEILKISYYVCLAASVNNLHRRHICGPCFQNDECSCYIGIYTTCLKPSVFEKTDMPLLVFFGCRNSRLITYIPSPPQLNFDIVFGFSSYVTFENLKYKLLRILRNSVILV